MSPFAQAPSSSIVLEALFYWIRLSMNSIVERIYRLEPCTSVQGLVQLYKPHHYIQSTDLLDEGLLLNTGLIVERIYRLELCTSVQSLVQLYKPHHYIHTSKRSECGVVSCVGIHTGEMG